MSISIMAIRFEGHIKTQSIYEFFIGFHRSVISLLVSGTLVKFPTVCNVVSRKTRFQIDYK